MDPSSIDSIRRLLVSDWYPLGTHRQALVNDLQKGFPIMPDLDKRIAVCDAQLACDDGQRSDLQLSSLKRGLLAPIRILVPEVLVQIFHITVEESRMHLYTGGCSSDSRCCVSTLPLVGRVCKRWQRIVIGTPSLWARFFVSIGCINKHGCIEWAMSRVNAYIANSRSHPLSITISHGHTMLHTTAVGSVSAEACLEKLGSQMYRIRELKLRGRSPYERTLRLESITHREASLLELLEVSQDGPVFQDQPYDPISAPRLRTLVLSSVTSLRFCMPALHQTSLNGLRILDLQGKSWITPKLILHILPSTPVLRTLRIASRQLHVESRRLSNLTDELEPEEPERISLPCLEKLIIACPLQDLCKVFTLDAPRLLYLKILAQDGGFTAADLGKILTGENLCSIETLEIHEKRVTPISTVRMLPKLRRIKIRVPFRQIDYDATSLLECCECCDLTHITIFAQTVNQDSIHSILEHRPAVHISICLCQSESDLDHDHSRMLPWESSIKKYKMLQAKIVKPNRDLLDIMEQAKIGKPNTDFVPFTRSSGYGY